MEKLFKELKNEFETKVNSIDLITEECESVTKMLVFRYERIQIDDGLGHNICISPAPVGYDIKTATGLDYRDIFDSEMVDELNKYGFKFEIYKHWLTLYAEVDKSNIIETVTFLLDFIENFG